MEIVNVRSVSLARALMVMLSFISGVLKNTNKLGPIFAFEDRYLITIVLAKQGMNDGSLRIVTGLE